MAPRRAALTAVADPEPLVRRYPILHRLRRIDSWWALADALDRSPIDAAAADEALTALAALDRSWNDTPSADAHETFRARLGAALAGGVPAAFEQHAAQVRAAMPGEIAAALAAIDRHVLASLTDRAATHLQHAEDAWVNLARSVDVDALPLPLRISVVCDAALLHQVVFDRSPTRTGLDHLAGVLRAALTLFRRFEAHPPLCALHLDPRLQTITGALAVALRTRFAVSEQRRGDLDDAIDLHRLLLQLTHPAAPELPLYLAEYGRTLGYQGTAGIDAGTAALTQAAELETPGSPERLANLALAAKGHMAVFAATREQARLGAAIAALEPALGETAGRVDRTHLRLLAEAHLQRAALRCADEDVEAATKLLGDENRDSETGAAAMSRLLEAITSILPAPDAGGVVDAALDVLSACTPPQDAAAVAAHAAKLARLLGIHDAGRRQAHLLDRMVRLIEIAQALDAQSSEAADRLNNLALLLAARFARRGDARDLGRAVEAARRALEITPPDEESRRRDYANALGTLLVRRYDAAGAPADIEEAVSALEWALGDPAAPQAALDPERLSGYMGNLGSALRQLSERRRTRADLDRAIAILEEGAAVAGTVGGPALVRALNNLGAAYHDRWRRFAAVSDLDRAIARWSEAGGHLDAADVGAAPERPGGAPQAAADLLRADGTEMAAPSPGILGLNRGSAILSRYERDGTAEDLEESIRLLESAIPLLDEYSPDRALAANRLAAALHVRALRDQDPSAQDRATDWSRHALSWAASASVETRFRVAWDWGGRAAATGAWQDASEAYAAGLASMRQLLEASLTVRERESVLADAFGLPTRAAYAMARAGQLRDAVIALEYGRGLLLADRIGVADARLEARAGAAHPDVLREYRAATGRWRALADRIELPDPAHEPVRWVDVEDARGALLRARHQLASLPDLEDALGPPSYDEVASAAGAQLLYLVPGQAAGMALLLRAGAPAPALVDLPQLGETVVGRETRAFVSAYQQIAADPDAWPAALDRLTRWLGDALAPAMAATGGARTIVIPTGALAFLPLHAAWTDDARTPTGRRYALDEACLSLAPTALSLAPARQRSTALDAAASLLVISNPEPSAATPLAYAGIEARMAASHLAPAQQLEGRAATVEAVRAHLRSHAVAHFACHARSVPEDPRRSGILHAHDRMLTVADLVALDLPGARLAVLSACETGIPGAEAPDEVIGIATALFAAGFAGVVASLWPVLDASTLLVITRFYEYWRGADGERSDPAEALVLAQRWVRDTTNDEKRRHWDALAAQGLLPEEAHRAISGELSIRQPGARSFASPDDWAPFVFVGV